jgi:hypothetical protein
MDRRSAGKITNKGETKMRTTTTRSKLTLLFMAFAMMLALPAVALADNLQLNDLSIGGNATKAPGDAGTATARIMGNAENGDIKGCNVDASNPATVTLSSSDASKVTLASSSVEITDCGSAGQKTVGYTVTNQAQNSDVITVSGVVSGGKPDSKFDNDSFTITISGGTVTPPPPPADTTPPVIGYTLNPASPDGSNGWYKSDVVVDWTVTDDESAISSQTGCDDFTISSDQLAQDYTCEATSAGGTDAVTTDMIKRDATKPTNVQFTNAGGITDGASYDFGSVPAAPSGCSAQDATSGLDSCVLSGGGTGVGSQTLTARATDNAGNVETKTLSYTVAAATAKGFYQPIDMNNALNTVKGGSTVPAKFELFGGASGAEQKALSAVSSVSAKQINCATLTGVQDAIEEIVSTNATGLRFDTTGDQFIYNWKTPKSPGTCYSLTMTAADQQTKLVAFFKLT